MKRSIPRIFEGDWVCKIWFSNNAGKLRVLKSRTGTVIGLKRRRISNGQRCLSGSTGRCHLTLCSTRRMPRIEYAAYRVFSLNLRYVGCGDMSARQIVKCLGLGPILGWWWWRFRSHYSSTQYSRLPTLTWGRRHYTQV